MTHLTLDYINEHDQGGRPDDLQFIVNRRFLITISQVDLDDHLQAYTVETIDTHRDSPETFDGLTFFKADDRTYDDKEYAKMILVYDDIKEVETIPFSTLEEAMAYATQKVIILYKEGPF